MWNVWTKLKKIWVSYSFVSNLHLHFKKILIRIKETFSAKIKRNVKNFYFVDILVFYFSGICVSASTQDLVEKKRLGLLLRRPEIVYDLALVMPDKSLFPLMTLQLLLCQLHWGIKRKLIILDSRIATEDDEVGWVNEIKLRWIH